MVCVTVFEAAPGASLRCSWNVDVPKSGALELRAHVKDLASCFQDAAFNPVLNGSNCDRCVVPRVATFKRCNRNYADWIRELYSRWQGVWWC